MSPSYPKIHLRREVFKFSSAHMTVFPDGSKEPLHGHNYSVEVTIDLKQIKLNEMIPFSSFKGAIKEICESWDEKLLLGSECPFFEIRQNAGNEIEFILCKKRYVLPRDEVILLKVDNITAENLAQEFCSQFIARIRTNNLIHKIDQIQIRIDESPGQGASVCWKNSIG